MPIGSTHRTKATKNWLLLVLLLLLTGSIYTITLLRFNQPNTPSEHVPPR